MEHQMRTEKFYTDGVEGVFVIDSFKVTLNYGLKDGAEEAWISIRPLHRSSGPETIGFHALNRGVLGDMQIYGYSLIFACSTAHQDEDSLKEWLCSANASLSQEVEKGPGNSQTDAGIAFPSAIDGPAKAQSNMSAGTVPPNSDSIPGRSLESYETGFGDVVTGAQSSALSAQKRPISPDTAYERTETGYTPSPTSKVPRPG